MRIFLAILFTVFSGIATGQTGATRVSPPAKSVVVNEKDAQGRPNGLWVLSEPAAMGEPATTEFGKYEHGLKYGPWYTLDIEGELMSMETFRNNVLDGEAKYFTKGRLSAIGYYKGLNPEREYDTILVEDPVTGAQILRPVHNERNTVRHGPWQFYDSETGRLVKEEEYQADSLIYSKNFPMSKADSVLYKKREAKMPHNRNTSQRPERKSKFLR